MGHVLRGFGEVLPVLGLLHHGGEEGRLVDLGLWGVTLGLLEELWRGPQGVEEFLEPLAGHVLVGVGEVAPVPGQLQQVGEEGRLVDLGLWGEPQKLLLSHGGGLLGPLHGDGRRLDEGPAKNSTAGVCFLGFLYISQNCLSTAVKDTRR